MSLQPPADIQVVKKEDKTARLTDFITQAVASGQVDADNANTCMDVSVFARSVESPVIQALATSIADLQKAGARVRMVLTGLELEDIDGAAVTAPLAKARVDVRVINDPRLLDAHEQLCIGEDVAWIGDCLRREPAKRDAYERFSENCAATSQSARTTFESVWARASTFTLPGHETEMLGLSVPDLSLNATGVEGEFGGATAATRH